MNPKPNPYDPTEQTHPTGPPADDPNDRSFDPALGDVEQLLGRMKLRHPSAALDGRVFRVIRRRTIWAQARVMGLAAAAVLAVAVGAAPLLRRLMPLPPAPPIATGPGAVTHGTTVNPAPLQPLVQEAGPRGAVRVERTIARISDDGIVAHVADVPLQRFRRQSVRQVWLVDPRTGERTAVTIPQEEIVVIRVRPF